MAQHFLKEQYQLYFTCWSLNARSQSVPRLRNFAAPTNKLLPALSFNCLSFWTNSTSASSYCRGISVLSPGFCGIATVPVHASSLCSLTRLFSVACDTLATTAFKVCDAKRPSMDNFPTSIFSISHSTPSGYIPIVPWLPCFATIAESSALGT